MTQNTDLAGLLGHLAVTAQAVSELPVLLNMLLPIL